MQIVTGKLVLTVLSVMVLLQIVLMIFYLHDNHVARRTAQRNQVIQKIINTVYLVESTPSKQRRKALSAMQDPYITASYTNKPEWPLRFQHISFWQINKTLYQRVRDFAMSIEMAKGQWLNLKATIYTHYITKQLVIVAAEVVVLLVLLFAFWMMNRYTRPIENFKDAIERLGMDLHSQPLDVNGPNVIREAAKAMNAMQQRLQDLIRGRTQMLAAISHDLRTPITRLKLRSQFVEDAALAENFVQDLDEMEQMINETLDFAKDDHHKEGKVRLDIVSFLRAMCDDMSDLGQPVQFQEKVQRIAIMARPLNLKRALSNLINNAVRYGECAQVSIDKKRQFAVITIKDEGPGIPTKELQEVFMPFYRGEYSRSRDTGGSGLGLAVTKHIIDNHHGTIVLSNRKNKGLCVTIRLPISE